MVELVRGRFVPSADSVRLLLESVSEVERVFDDALPPAGIAAHAVAAIAERRPELERVVVATRGFAHAGIPTRLAGVIATPNPGLIHARLRASQLGDPVLDVEALGREGSAVPRPRRLVPPELEQFARALGQGPDRYAEAPAWPSEFVVALAAAGVEAEEQDGLARLLKLTVEFAAPAPLSERLHFAIDGVKPVSCDLARIVFRVTRGRSRLVARGDAVIVSALARSAAIALRRAA
jgi:hypothetical protein